MDGQEFKEPQTSQADEYELQDKDNDGGAEAFKIGQRGTFVCWICLKEFELCLNVKEHIHRTHTKAFCAQRRMGVSILQSHHELLLFCPRNCQYVTSQIFAFFKHLTSCQKPKLQPEDKDFLDLQMNFMIKEYNQLNEKLASEGASKGPEQHQLSSSSTKRKGKQDISPLHAPSANSEEVKGPEVECSGKDDSRDSCVEADPSNQCPRISELAERQKMSSMERNSNDDYTMYTCEWCCLIFPTRQLLEYHAEDCQKERDQETLHKKRNAHDFNHSKPSPESDTTLQVSDKTLRTRGSNLSKQRSQISSRCKKITRKKGGKHSGMRNKKLLKTEDKEDENCLGNDKGNNKKLLIIVLTKPSDYNKKLDFGKGSQKPSGEETLKCDNNGSIETCSISKSNVIYRPILPHLNSPFPSCQSSGLSHQEAGLNNAGAYSPFLDSSLGPKKPENELLKCDVCWHRFISGDNLARHMRIHNNEDNISGQTSQTSHPPGPKVTVTGQQEEDLFECDQCSKSFKKKSGLYFHKKTHSLEKPFECKICGKRFRRKHDLLVRHMRAHSEEKLFPCTLCDKRFNHPSSLHSHMSRHVGKKTFVCHECGLSFHEKGALQRHMLSIKHGGEKLSKCPECGKSLSGSGSLYTHMKMHSGEKPFQCDECGKRFMRKCDLENHMKRHSGEKPFTCNECGKSFCMNNDLVRHRRIHSQERSAGWKCDECGQHFRFKKELNEHRRTHKNEWP